MKVNFQTNSIINRSLKNMNRISFGEADVPENYFETRKGESSRLYKEIKREEIKNKYYRKFKILYERADSGEIDNNLFWIMKNRLESQKAAELIAVEKGVY